ncbi:MAG: hypothetical protein ACREDO_09085 [Methyloceanibacter sp.]
MNLKGFCPKWLTLKSQTPGGHRALVEKHSKKQKPCLPQRQRKRGTLKLPELIAALNDALSQRSAVASSVKTVR